MQKLLFQLFIATIALSSYSQNYFHSDNSADIISRGINDYNFDRFDDAILAFDSISESDTNFLWAQYEKALSLMALEKYDESVQIASEFALEQTIYSSSFYNTWGSALDKQGKPDKALIVFNEALEKFPYSTSLLLNKGVAFITKGDIDSAISCFQKGIEINYFHSSLHAKLAAAYLIQGRKIPAIYALTAYLTIEPSGYHSKSVVQQLLDINEGKNFVIDSLKNPSPKEDKQFEQVSKLYNAKLSYNKAYKVKSKLKDMIVKQQHLVLSKTSYVESNKDFVNRHYVRYFDALIKNGYFEPLSYLWFISVNSEKIQTLYRKNKKKISEALELYYKMIYETREFQIANIDGTEAEYYHWYNKNNNLEAISKTVKIDGEYLADGKMHLISPYGNFIGYKNYAKGALHGKTASRYYSGIIQEEANYINGKLNGLYTFYNYDGTRDIEIEYKDGEIAGEIRHFNNFNIINSVSTKNDGHFNGPVKLFDQFGELEIERMLVNDKLEGISLHHNKWNSLIDTAYIKENKYEGRTVEYYSNGQLKLEGIYSNSIPTGKWNIFHPNGQLKLIKQFDSKGELDGLIISYYDDGTIEKKEEFSNGKFNGTSEYFDTDGKLWYSLVYEHDKLLSYNSYDKAGNIIHSDSKKGNKLNLMLHYPTGEIRIKAELIDDSFEGRYEVFYRNGQTKYFQNYTDGKLNGQYKEFFKNGTIKKEYILKDDQISGMYTEYFKNGLVYIKCMYTNNLRNGDCYYYFPDGTLSSKHFYMAGEINGWNYYYEVDGKLSNSTLFKNGYIEKMHTYDTLGNCILSDSLEWGSGYFETVFWNNAKKAEGKVVANKNDSIYTSFYPSGKIKEQRRYNKGDLFDTCKIFYENGNLHALQVYEFGEKSGQWISYHPNGKISSKTSYKADLRSGNWQYYNKDGVLYNELQYSAGKLNGTEKYYLPDGSLGFKLFFENNVLTAYTYLDENGSELPPIAIENETADIICYHPNGTMACKMKYISGYIEGKRLLYFPNGQLYSSVQFEHSEANGKAEYYYENGKLKKVRNYFYDNLHGIQYIYRKNGSLETSEQFKHGLLHGLKKHFTADGTLSKTENYIYDYKYQ